MNTWSRIYRRFHFKLGLQHSGTCWNLIALCHSVIAQHHISVPFGSLRVCTHS
jgi:hypothetical protein